MRKKIVGTSFQKGLEIPESQLDLPSVWHIYRACRRQSQVHEMERKDHSPSSGHWCLPGKLWARGGGQWRPASWWKNWGPVRVKLHSPLPGILALDTNRAPELGENLSIGIVSHSGLVRDTRRGVGELPYIEMGKLESERIGESNPF